MTAGTSKSLAARPAPSQDEIARQYYEHSTAKRTNTDCVVVEALRAEYPNLHLTVVARFGVDLLGFAAAGKAGLAPIDNAKDHLSWRAYIPPARRLDGARGGLIDYVKFGKYMLDWQGKEYILYYAEGRDGNEPYGFVLNQYILSASIEATNQLLIEAGIWNNGLHNEVWVFDSGFWQKSSDLWDSVQKASWDDVILDEDMKKAIISDVETFFDSQDTYQKLKVPWKRGIIYHGPPGNGKTISIKAMMHSLYQRKEPIPTLYVKSLTSFGGPERGINSVFQLARRTAPCYLVFEDLDSIITDAVRSYFLNAVDGIESNDGILMVGSTNHLDRLDPGLAKRPSRFDRKYLFANPNLDERTLYIKYWQGKLEDNQDLDFPDKICSATAKITDGFSFAYLQEAMVASLLALAREEDNFSERTCFECVKPHAKPENGSLCDEVDRRQPRNIVPGDSKAMVRQVDEENPDLDNYVLWREIKKQVRLLREQLQSSKGLPRTNVVGC